MQAGNYLVIHDRWLEGVKGKKTYSFSVINGQVIASTTEEYNIINALMNQTEYAGMTSNSERRTLVIDRATRKAIFLPHQLKSLFSPKCMGSSSST